MFVKTIKFGSLQCTSGLEINFFAQVPAGDYWEKFGRQIVNFGRQVILK